MADGLMTDIMVDIETMGTSVRSGIIQIAAIKFNFETGEIGETFDRCPAPLPFRQWDDSTREFWQVRNRNVYLQIISRQEPGPQVYHDFFHWVGKDGVDYRFWAKPLSFDWPILADNMEQVGLPMPFHYRIARDQNSYMAALKGSPEHPAFDDGKVFTGDEHNALHDAAFQIDMLMDAKRRYISTEVME